MNFHNFNSDYVEQQTHSSSYPTYITHPSTDTPPTTASQVTVLHAQLAHAAGEQQSSSPQPNVVPSVPSPSTPSVSEIYGPDRLFPQQRAAPYHVPEPANPRPLVRFDEQLATGALPPTKLFYYNSMEFKDELTREVENSITPGINSTPYIQYALDALTRRREDESREASSNPSSASDEANPMFRFMPNSTPGLFQPAPVHLVAGPSVPRDTNHYQNITSPEEELAARRARRTGPTSSYPGLVQVRYNSDSVPSSLNSYEKRDWDNYPEWGAAKMLGELPPPSPMDEDHLPRNVEHWQAHNEGQLPQIADHRHIQEEDQIPQDADHRQAQDEDQISRVSHHIQAQRDEHHDPEKAQVHCPPLKFKPWILRTQSLALLAALCFLMIVALIFCAVYSSSHNGLVAYSGTIYDGNYFVFRILPQLLAAVLLIYAQSVITTAFRVLPFSAMSSDTVLERRDVGFLPLYPKSFLWPQLVGTWHVWIPIFITWILNITVPLQSGLFTVVLVKGIWTWSTVQGVAWILVATYVTLLLSTGVLIMFWHTRQTGMLPNWDLRSIADMIFLISQSNSQAYEGTEKVATRTDMKSMLKCNTERLGHWYAPGAAGHGRWYGIGVPAGDEVVDVEKFGPASHLKDYRDTHSVNSAELEGTSDRINVRYRYLPWCFRNSQIIFWVVAASVLLIALFVVSFNYSTDLRRGFLPGLSAAPVQGAFSAADFLYSFIPSLIGMLLFLMFQSLDLTLRILTPWGELSRKDGSRARTSILVDYAACLPLESTWKAAKNRQWRVAFVSFLSTFLVLIPVLAGGLFMALTPPSLEVRMYPNVPVFGILLTLLVLLLLGLISLVPKRDQFRLPHAVTCIAEIISFCSNEELRTDEAFQSLVSRVELKGKVGAFSDKEDRWYFGTGRNRNERLGIKRYNKYTSDHHKRRATQRAKAQQTNPELERIMPKWNRPQQPQAAEYSRLPRWDISRPVVGNTYSNSMMR